ncbi:Fasciclin-like arabinogalactan protein [Melia azedarach]|uniref:Fasciclin-like arabinogalactan protein n=1 Tax=Melia azedarach TaxID=155640 RepID=A0ACC1Y4Z7_MELAZ|nr:Fasciclin-like arabinogalactan protein [Melia azedarach]
MNSKAFALIFPLFFIFFSAANSFNITKILNDNSDFSTFNELLTQTGLAKKINSRSTITVLALDSGAVGSLQGKPRNEIENILSNHVVLDYYDIEKLKKLPNKTSILTTMFQATGSAQIGQGFLNVTRTSSGDVVFGSGVKDSPVNAKAVKSVYSQPYNISVIQISKAIVAPGIEAAHSPESAKSQEPLRWPAKAPSGSGGNSTDDQSEAPTDESASAPEASSPEESGDEQNSAQSATPPAGGDASSGSSTVGYRGGVAVVVLTGLVLSFVGF